MAAFLFCSISTQSDVHLVAGLPLTWIRKQREDFRSYLLRNKEVDFRFNGKDYHIRFVGCSLFPQGYPAIVSRLGDFKGTNILADIGNGTMNIFVRQPKDMNISPLPTFAGRSKP